MIEMETAIFICGQVHLFLGEEYLTEINWQRQQLTDLGVYCLQYLSGLIMTRYAVKGGNPILEISVSSFLWVRMVDSVGSILKGKKCLPVTLALLGDDCDKRNVTTVSTS